MTSFLQQLLLNAEEENNKSEPISHKEESESEIPDDAMYCEGIMENQSTRIIIDSGSVSNVISGKFLKQINQKIDQPSNINLVDINGKHERLLGEIKQLKINIGDCEQ